MMGPERSSPQRAEQSSGDRAGADYWDRLWGNESLPAAIDPYGHGVKNFPARRFHQYFQEAFKGLPAQGRKLLEVGCAQSALLPYFSKHFGFEVFGIDRSEIGCEKARKVLQREEVAGQIYCGDLFSPPGELLGQFDAVLSMGVIEHFEKTAECVTAMARFLKPGGRLITVIPNLAGVLGSLQKALDRSVYDVHVPLDRLRVAGAHREAGLEVIRCDYFLFANFCVLNVENWRQGAAYKSVVRLCYRISEVFWLAEEFLPLFKPNPWSSPYINCVARKLCA